MNCFCRVSGIICDLLIKPFRPGTENPAGALFDCVNRCMFNEYERKDSALWRQALKVCSKAGITSMQCCDAMVHAEQDALETCFYNCRTIPNAGSPPDWWWYCTPDNSLWSSIPDYVPKFPFAADLMTRVGAARKTCCRGTSGDPVR